MAHSMFAVSPLRATVETDGDVMSLWRAELRDLARGFAGALFLALPLLFTMEMWERARAIPTWDLVLIVGGAYLANVGFGAFGGFKPEIRRRSVWFDATTAMGIGLVAGTVTLALINQLHSGLPPDIAIKLMLLEMVPCSFGASLAVNQLGTSGEHGEEIASRFGPDRRKVLGTLLGALMFSFNIAPTMEVQVIGNGLTRYHLIGLVLFSLFVSAVLVFFADLAERDGDEGLLASRVSETCISYLLSLLVSAALLWMFGYIGVGTPLQLVVPWVVALGYVTTLAGAAGRMIL